MSNRLQRGPGTLTPLDLRPAERMAVFASVNGHAQTAVVVRETQFRPQVTCQPGR
jgi:hypothetical protein